MDADGSHKQQLTHFNEAGYPEYMNGMRCVASDSAWSPEGKEIIATVAYDTFWGMRSKMVLIPIE